MTRFRSFGAARPIRVLASILLVLAVCGLMAADDAKGAPGASALGVEDSRGSMLVTATSSATLAAALKAAQAGDTIQLASGVYADVSIRGLNFATGVTITSQDPSAPATITDLNVRDSSGLTFSNIDFRADTGSQFIVRGSHDVGFDHIRVHGSLDGNAQNDPGGFLIRDSADISVTDSEFQQLYWALSHDTVEGLLVRGNSFHDLRMDAVRGGGSSEVEISRNSFWNFDPKAGDHNDAIQFWTAGTTTAVHDILIADNVFMRGSGVIAQGVFFHDEVGHLPFEHVVIRGNLISGAMYNGISINGGRDVLIEDNIVQGYADMKSWIRLLNVDDARLVDNATNEVVLTDIQNVSQAGTTILPLATDAGAAVKATWDAIQFALPPPVTVQPPPEDAVSGEPALPPTVMLPPAPPLPIDIAAPLPPAPPLDDLVLAPDFMPDLSAFGSGWLLEF